MALPGKPTLGELRAEVLARLGFAAQGAAAGNLVTTVDSYLKRAQDYLYWKYDFKELRRLRDIAVNPGQTLYDWPDDMEPRRLVSVQVLDNGIWVPLEEGIEYFHDTVADTRFHPRRFDRRDQLEIWPQPDASYTLRIEYYQRLARFTQDGDRCTIDDALLFNYALAKAKRHYNQPDAQDYFDEVADLLRRLKSGEHGHKRYVVGEKPGTPMPRPKVIDYT